MKFLDQLLAAGFIPDPIIRMGINRLLAKKERDEYADDPVEAQRRFMDHIRSLDHAPIAIETDAANEQHYEVPTRFYQLCLGRRLKYSSCLYPRGDETLDEAEELMLSLTCERAELCDGITILELGCGWGALTLWMAEKYPTAKITAISNSRTQKEHIEATAAERGLGNIRVITADMNVFDTEESFDRVVSVEMFEHMKNHRALLRRVARFLKPNGLLFIHIFTHTSIAYHYEGKDPSDWITRYFFSGGQMPSDHQLLYFQEDLLITNHWRVNGRHYARTAQHWLQNMDRHKEEILPLFEKTYGAGEATRWWNYWRIFFMSCSGLWGWKNGTRWLVSHYLFRKK